MLHEYNLLAFIAPPVTILQQPEPSPAAKNGTRASENVLVRFGGLNINLKTHREE